MAKSEGDFLLDDKARKRAALKYQIKDSERALHQLLIQLPCFVADAALHENISLLISYYHSLYRSLTGHSFVIEPSLETCLDALTARECYLSLSKYREQHVLLDQEDIEYLLTQYQRLLPFFATTPLPIVHENENKDLLIFIEKISTASDLDAFIAFLNFYKDQNPNTVLSLLFHASPENLAMLQSFYLRIEIIKIFYTLKSWPCYDDVYRFAEQIHDFIAITYTQKTQKKWVSMWVSSFDLPLGFSWNISPILKNKLQDILQQQDLTPKTKVHIADELLNRILAPYTPQDFLDWLKLQIQDKVEQIFIDFKDKSLFYCLTLFSRLNSPDIKTLIQAQNDDDAEDIFRVYAHLTQHLEAILKSYGITYEPPSKEKTLDIKDRAIQVSKDNKPTSTSLNDLFLALEDKYLKQTHQPNEHGD